VALLNNPTSDELSSDNNDGCNFEYGGYCSDQKAHHLLRVCVRVRTTAAAAAACRSVVRRTRTAAGGGGACAEPRGLAREGARGRDLAREG
jgi:hypothetical protein